MEELTKKEYEVLLLSLLDQLRFTLVKSDEQVREIAKLYVKLLKEYEEKYG